VREALLIACSFLTRLPVPTREFSPQRFGAAAACFPLIGLGIGALGLLVLQLCAARLGSDLGAWLALAALAAISGGLHLDGLADWFDALGGGRGQRERMLEIMRDPRIGAHGAAALILLLAAKHSALAGLPSSGWALALLGAPVAARAAAVWLLALLPSARSEGLGATFTSHVRLRHAGWASLFAVVTCAALGVPALLALLACGAMALAVAGWAKLRLGGINGDVCGAAIELGELAFWLACRALL
jgi:adenosylcobinamide-GDP ribazoletransferase